MTKFQMKVRGQWTDTEIPGCSDLKNVGNLIMTMGKKPNSNEMKFFADLVRNKWGFGAFRDDLGNPIENLDQYDDKTFLKLGHMFMVKYQDDVLRLELYYEHKILGSRQTKSGNMVNSWVRNDGCVEVTLMSR